MKKRWITRLAWLVVSVPAISAGQLSETHGLPTGQRINPFTKPQAQVEVSIERVIENDVIIEVPPPWSRELRATAVAGDASMANVDGIIVMLGEEIEGFTLIEVRERVAVFEKDGYRQTLTMN